MPPSQPAPHAHFPTEKSNTPSAAETAQTRPGFRSLSEAFSSRVSATRSRKARPSNGPHDAATHGRGSIRPRQEVARRRRSRHPAPIGIEGSDSNSPSSTGNRPGKTTAFQVMERTYRVSATVGRTERDTDFVSRLQICQR